MRRLFTFTFVLLAAGCTYEWNDGAPALPLSGEAPPLSSLHRLNTMVSGRASLMTGPDGAAWAAFCEFWDAGSSSTARNCKRMHLARLDGTAGDEVRLADAFSLQGQELYEMRDDTTAMTRTVTLHQPGNAAGDVAFVMPAGKALLYVNDDGASDVFVYWLEDPATTSYTVFRRDRAEQRSFPIPDSVDPTAPDDQSQFDFQLTSDGATLVVRDPDTTMTAYSTLDSGMQSLGARPFDFFIDNPHQAVLTVGDDGFRSVPLGGGPDLVLSSDSFDPSTLLILGDDAYYTDAGLWHVPLDGSAAAQLVAPDAQRLWVTGPAPQIATSRDPGNRYAGGAGDGWVGDWQFMQRGRVVRWSGDGTRIRFLEHAATLGVYGDLTSVLVPGGAPSTLGLNVHSYAELPDGRLLAVENAVYAGDWNRLVVIDEAAQTKHWVVPSAADFFLVPGGGPIVADVVSGASGFDIFAVPAPP